MMGAVVGGGPRYKVIEFAAELSLCASVAVGLHDEWLIAMCEVKPQQDCSKVHTEQKQENSMEAMRSIRR